MQTAIDIYLVTGLNHNFRRLQRSKMNPPLRVILLFTIFLRALVCWFWHRLHLQAVHCFSQLHYFSIRYGTTVLVISFAWRWVSPSVLNQISQTQWRTWVSIYRCHSSALPSWVKKEIAMEGHIKKQIYIAEIELTGLYFKACPFQVAKLIQLKFFLSHLLASSLWCLCSIPHLPAQEYSIITPWNSGA